MGKNSHINKKNIIKSKEIALFFYKKKKNNNNKKKQYQKEKKQLERKYIILKFVL